jgi:FlgD Ig-like domain
MKKSILLAWLLLLGSAAPTQAVMRVGYLWNNDDSCSSPAVACAPDGMSMVAYTATGTILMDFVVTQRISTTAYDNEGLYDPVALYAGSTPSLRWTREGFVCAFSSGGAILIFQSDLDGIWDLENYELIFTDGEVMGIDLWGAGSDAAGPNVYLTYQTSVNPPDADYRVYYASGSLLGWTTPELVATEPTLMPHPQITWGIGPAGPWPTIYYLSGPSISPQLVHSTKDLAAGWSLPQAVPGDGLSSPTPFGGEFAVAISWDGTRHILGLGPQPVCPCRSIHHQVSEAWGDWLPEEEITAGRDAYDWPTSPRIVVDDAGMTHAFWTQQGAGETLVPGNRTLEYKVWSDGVWTDEGGFLADQPGRRLSPRVGLAVSPSGDPFLAWSRRDTVDGQPQPEQIWIARVDGMSPVAMEDPPALRAAISAWPNPFNPRVKLVVDVPRPGAVRLEIFDARGRRIRSLIDSVLTADRVEVTWDGTDRTGQAMPSGVYFARLAAGPQSAVHKLLLAK